MVPGSPLVLRFGFIGVGDIGGPMAARLIRSGCQTTLWARRPQSLEQFEPGAFHIADTPADVGRVSDTVGICVFGDQDMQAVVLGPDGVLSGMAPGGVIAIHSTVSVEAVEAVANAADQCGVSVLDAPISGARARAERGELTILAGGESGVFEAALPMLRCYGATITLVGKIGDAQKMKALNNALGMANLRLAYLALEVSEQLGLDPEKTQAILRSSSGASFALDLLVDRLLPDAAFCRHLLPLNLKDFSFFQELRISNGIAPSLLDQAAKESAELKRALGARGEPVQP